MDTQKNLAGDSIINIDAYNVTSRDSIINSNFSEEKWISKMKGVALNNEHKHDNGNPICIFQVPKSVSDLNPQAYTPQNIALGPYHQFQPKLYKFQKCKLEKIQFIHQQFNLPDLQVLFDQLKEKVEDVRGSYHEQLQISDDILSWIMIFDGMFLLRLIYHQNTNAEWLRFTYRHHRHCKQLLEMKNKQEEPLEFVDSFGKNISMDSILRDVVKLENQIPFFVLEHLVAMSNPSKLPSFLFFMTINFWPRISPISLHGFFPLDSSRYPLHLLDLLYNLVWFRPATSSLKDISADMPADFPAFRSSGPWLDLRDLISTLNIGFLIIPMKIIDLVIKVFEVLGLSISFQSAEEKAALVPTASELSNVRVKFCLTDVGIKSSSFIRKEATLTLPVLTLNVNSEVIIRNLLAYEAIAKPETRNFARFIEMIAAMIHSTEDVELLKNKEVLIYEGISNVEVVNLFDGLRNPIIVTEGESELDGHIKEINEYYETHWKIKLKKIMKKCAHKSWKILTILATILLLLLMTLQTLCSIYSCPHIFKASQKRLSFIYDF